MVGSKLFDRLEEAKDTSSTGKLCRSLHFRAVKRDRNFIKTCQKLPSNCKAILSAGSNIINNFQNRILPIFTYLIKYFLVFQYLKQNDCVELRHIIQNFPAPEEESLLLTSFIDKLGGLETSQDTDEDFKPLRIDWLRLQVRNLTEKRRLICTTICLFVYLSGVH